jgi:hypothetical protein
LSVAGTLGPPLTVTTSLMFYFGWARSDTQARSISLDVTLFGFTTQDYVMRSVSTLYIPLLVTVSIALGLAGAASSRPWLVVQWCSPRRGPQGRPEVVQLRPATPTLTTSPTNVWRTLPRPC